MTKEKFQDIVAFCGVASVVALVPLALWIIWSTPVLSIRCTLTDLMLFGICWIVSE